jgi:hypothetical protein
MTDDVRRLMTCHNLIDADVDILHDKRIRLNDIY